MCFQPWRWFLQSNTLGELTTETDFVSGFWHFISPSLAYLTLVLSRTPGQIPVIYLSDLYRVSRAVVCTTLTLIV